jgi:molecular chaperone HtpG
MKEGQDKIYFVTADSFAAAKNSPHLEIFRKKGIEVLLLCDRIDEWLISSLTDYDEKHLQSIAKGELDLDKFDSEEEKQHQEEVNKDFESMLKQITWRADTTHQNQETGGERLHQSPER